jgi:hypothetical protein
MEKLVDSSSECLDLVVAIKKLVSVEKLRSALKHFTSTIRLVGFQTIQSIVAAYSPQDSMGLSTISQEVELWEECFPYAIKTDGKEYKSSLLQCLTGFMDRLSNVESAYIGSEASGGESIAETDGLPLLHSFVVDFLIFKVAVQQAAYPASISEKEAFASDLLGCVLAFASRDPRFVPRNVAAYERKQRPSESVAAKRVLEALVNREGLASLFSLLHSSWDGSRSSSFRFLSRLVLVAQAKQLDFAPEYTAASVRDGMMGLSCFLAATARV